MYGTCPDCGVERVGPPKPGTCPCCYGEVKPKQTTFNRKKLVYVCENQSCKRVCTHDFLSGFWSGWRACEKGDGKKIKWQKNHED